MTQSSLPPRYFESLYAVDPDPWRFATSDYERGKYETTLSALPDGSTGDALEVGCSIGILTAQLAPRCRSLLAIDVAAKPLSDARERCAHLSNVRFEQMQVPQQWPYERFDFILFSEVLYYLDHEDIRKTAEHTLGSLNPGGFVLLVHWTGETNYPCSADEAVDIFMQATTPLLHVDHAARYPEYRLDRLRRL